MVGQKGVGLAFAPEVELAQSENSSEQPRASPTGMEKPRAPRQVIKKFTFLLASIKISLAAAVRQH